MWCRRSCRCLSISKLSAKRVKRSATSATAKAQRNWWHGPINTRRRRRNEQHSRSVMPFAKDISLERMFRAVEIVRERLLKVTHLLDTAQIPYAVIGAQAASAWIARV